MQNAETTYWLYLFINLVMLLPANKDWYRKKRQEILQKLESGDFTRDWIDKNTRTFGQNVGFGCFWGLILSISGLFGVYTIFWMFIEWETIGIAKFLLTSILYIFLWIRGAIMQIIS